MAKMTFRSSAEAAEPPGYWEKPAYQATLESQVWVPLFWSLITSLIPLLIGIAIAVYFRLPWIVPALLWLGAFSLSWLALSGFLRNLLRVIEPWVDADLDGDGHIGPKTTLRIEVQDNGKIRKIFDPDVFGFASDAAFVAFCRKLLELESLTEATWGKDYAAFPDGINQFRATRSKLMEQGYIERAGRTWEPTGILLAICEGVVNEK